eukprot:CAMPEP_0168460928 /NCGR_PEP_ID=MMETSP0228-20121227/53701_1 /TAXON_ID=133427 /ORGANISM="Protoceratium reticulatum, Strain CCCM 535 (=CCMP 1889)" /LENGTH=155 /DNA_ID=CAMNT_0008476185 /DNA_START=34 /DNA_END=498 /DNA_ORIENTATION=+
MLWGRSLLTPAFLAAVAAADCLEPFCRQEFAPCQNKKVSTCHLWPHFCAKWIHGDAVYCNADHDCVCAGGACASAQGHCVAPPEVECRKLVGTCEVWPHYCSSLIHGDAVSCSGDHTCLCGEGTCATAEEFCKPLSAFVSPVGASAVNASALLTT